jgi:hypothetical protein
MSRKSIIVVIYQSHKLLNLNNILCFVLLFHAKMKMEKKTTKNEPYVL